MLQECYSITGNDFEVLRPTRASGSRPIHRPFVSIGLETASFALDIKQRPSVTSQEPLDSLLSPWPLGW